MARNIKNRKEKKANVMARLFNFAFFDLHLGWEGSAVWAKKALRKSRRYL